MYFRHPLVPRNGHTPYVLIVARISGCAAQKEESLEDQEDHAKEVVAELYEGEVDYRVIATKAKGERLDRSELRVVEQCLRSGQFDLLICEDVGRLIRGSEANRLFGIAVDHGTRCIAPNDCIDTRDPNWEEDILSACRDHVGHNSHTSKRLKHKLMNRFQKQGGALPDLIAGYEKPAGARTFFDIRKIESATPIIREGAKRLLEHGNCSAVAQYFNKTSFPVGPSCRLEKWDGAMVRRFYKNPVLIGKPERGNMVTVKVHETGRRKSRKNPDGPLSIECPHLEHLDEAQFFQLNEFLAEKNAAQSRSANNRIDARKGVPRKRSRYPGQAGMCFYCGSHFVWGANGIRGSVVCARSRTWNCWNSIGMNGTLFVERLIDPLMTQLGALEGFDSQFRDLVQRAREKKSRNAELEVLRGEELELAKAQENFLASIEKYGPNEMFNKRFEEIREREKSVSRKKRMLERTVDLPLTLPETTEELIQVVKSSLVDLSSESFELSEVLHQIVPEFNVYLVRLCDGGHLLPRVRVKFDFSGISPDVRLVPGLSDLLQSEVSIDAFNPPQRERIRGEAVALRQQGVGPSAIADLIAEKPKMAAVQQSLALQEEMDRLGLDDPFVMIHEPPTDYTKLRRHKNPKYAFKCVDGYRPPLIE